MGPEVFTVQIQYGEAIRIQLPLKLAWGTFLPYAISSLSFLLLSHPETKYLLLFCFLAALTIHKCQVKNKIKLLRTRRFLNLSSLFIFRV